MGDPDRSEPARSRAIRRQEASVEIAAPAPVVMAVIADVASYPDWIEAITDADVLEFTPDAFGEERPVRVRLSVAAGPVTDSCTVRFRWPDDLTARCRMTRGGEGTLIRGLAGDMALEPLGDDTTTVTYSLGVDLADPLTSAEAEAAEAIIDSALAGLKSRVEG